MFFRIICLPSCPSLMSAFDSTSGNILHTKIVNSSFTLLSPSSTQKCMDSIQFSTTVLSLECMRTFRSNSHTVGSAVSSFGMDVSCFNHSDILKRSKLKYLFVHSTVLYVPLTKQNKFPFLRIYKWSNNSFGSYLFLRLGEVLRHPAQLSYLSLSTYPGYQHIGQHGKKQKQLSLASHICRWFNNHWEWRLRTG